MPGFADDLDNRMARLAPHACGVALATVDSLRRVDLRTGDGPLFMELNLKIEKSSGLVEIPPRVTVAHGGHPGPTLGTELIDEAIPGWNIDLKPATGGRYWFVFLAFDALSPMLVQVRPVNDPDVEQVFHAAIEKDALKWKPVYCRELNAQLEHRAVTPERWKVRVSREGTLRWRLGRSARDLRENALVGLLWR